MGLTVVVSGASGGIGRATALRFSKDAHDVFITGRSVAKLEETTKLPKGGWAIHKSIGDVGSEADVLRNHQAAIKALGHIDVLLLNAGRSWSVPLEEHTVADFDSLFNTNIRGVFLWLKAVLPVFKIFELDLALMPQDISDAIATIVYQDPSSDIAFLRILPNLGPKKRNV